MLQGCWMMRSVHPHQTWIITSLCTLLYAGHYDVDAGKGLPQAAATKLEAHFSLKYHRML